MTESSDSHQRAQALNPEHSFAVAAPAGSGKTELLTQRVLTLLSKVNHPEEVLCITFTRKAAGEMHTRIIQALQRAQYEAPDESHKRQTWKLAQQVLAHDEKQAWSLLQQPNRLKILTIDGLCAFLTKNLPIASGFGTSPEICQDASTLYEQAVEQLLRKLENNDETSQALAYLVQHLDCNLHKVRDLLVPLLAQRSQWLPLILETKNSSQARVYLERWLSSVVTEHLLHTEQLLQQVGADIPSELAQILDYAGSNLQHELTQGNDTKKPSPLHALVDLAGCCELPLPEVEQLHLWQAMSHLLLKSDHGWRKQFNKSCGFPSPTSKPEKELAKARKDHAKSICALLASSSELHEQLILIKHLPVPHYRPQQWDLLEALTKLLPILVAELALVFRQQGQVDYTEINTAAISALEDEQGPTDLALKLDYRIQHILVDEFQDTSQPQLDLLKYLTAGWQTGDGKTLFIVGDGMQSCYGFREANVSIFLNARDRGIGDIRLTKLDLKNNFRSQAGIIHWINTHFCTAFPAREDKARGAVPYSPSEPVNPELDTPPVTCALIEQTQDSTASRLAEAAYVATTAKILRQNHPDETTAILVRSRSHLQTIIPALQAEQLTWQATDIDPLTTRTGILDLIALLKALLHPGDRIAWLSILRAPWCGLNLDDLHGLAGLEGQKQSIWQRILHAETLTLSTDGKQRIARLRQVLQVAFEQRLRKPLTVWLEGIWLALGGPACVDSYELSDIETFFRLLQQLAIAGGSIDMDNLEHEINKLYAQANPEHDSKLIIMTLHKSKGLEFDNVIIPSLDREGRNDTHNLLLWQQRLSTSGEEMLLMSPITASDEADKDPIFNFIKQEHTQKNRLESTRLLYVGATRAVKRLYLSACAKADEKHESGWKAPGKNSLLYSLWQSFLEQAELIHAQDNSEPQTKNTEEPYALGQIRRLKTHWSNNHLHYHEPHYHLLKAYRGQSSESQDVEEDEQNRPEVQINQHDRLLGILVHRILQHNAHLGLEGIKEQFQHQQLMRNIWRQWLLESGIAIAHLNATLDKLQLALQRICHDPQGAWLLDPTHEQSANELAVSVKFKKIQHYIIDRTFIDAGIRWVIDFKITAPEQQSIDEFFKQNAQQYQSQLKNYRDYFSLQAPNTPIKTVLYFPLLPQLVEIYANGAYQILHLKQEQAYANA